MPSVNDFCNNGKCSMWKWSKSQVIVIKPTQKSVNSYTLELEVHFLPFINL